MNISDFKFTSRQIVPTVFETLLTAPNGEVFGIIYRSMMQAPDEEIFKAFCSDKKQFFIDIAPISVTTIIKQIEYEI